MTDPNVTYKTGFAELVLKLGRIPTMKDAELLQLHEEYKKSWITSAGIAEPISDSTDACGDTRMTTVSLTEVPARTGASGVRGSELTSRASAAGPQSGFSRQPAPQARTYDSDARTREDQEATGAPDKPAEPEEAVTAPEPVREYPRAAEPVLVVASAPCSACGREFERVARRGRPPVRCEECR